MENIETHKLTWRGRQLTIRYNPRSFVGYGHLQISVRSCRPLPITETGYRSHFVAPVDVEEIGGPVAYVQAWLDAMAQTKAWRRTEQGGLQLQLI